MPSRTIEAIRRLRALAGGVLSNQSGAALPLIGLGFFALLCATGMAVDMSRMQSARAKLGNALDAAGLAAGTKAHSGNLRNVVGNYLRVNYPDGYLDSRIIDYDVQANADNTILTLQATAEVDMVFMQIFGFGTRVISAEAEITRENRGVEMVMVLDVTGSMYGSKISDLRTAATDMVNILFGSEEEMENLWVGIVPYSTTVNVGPDKTDWLRNYDLSRYPSKYPNWATKWKGCVEERGQWPDTSGLDLTDDIPYTGNKATATAAQLATTFPMYFWDDASDNDWLDNRGNVSLNQNAGYSDNDARGPNVGCGNEVTPFTNEKSTVQAGVNALTPWRRGGTMSSIGMGWAWRMISPKWRGMWGHGDPSLPLDYNTPLMSKAVIVMTDGVNEVFSTGDLPKGAGSDYTGYRRISEQRMGAGINTKAEGIQAVNDKFLALCAAMKEEGILIYTVTFQLNNSTSANNARALFRDCATHPDYYFDSPDGATLRQAFRTIGDSLANLMISR